MSKPTVEEMRHRAALAVQKFYGYNSLDNVSQGMRSLLVDFAVAELDALTTAHEADARKRFIEELFEIQTMGGKDEIHCSCLPYALVTLSGEEGSPESDAMEARLKALRLPQDPLPTSPEPV